MAMNVAVNKKKGKLSGAFEINAWSDEPALPDISPADAGNALVVDENGEIVTREVGEKIYIHCIYFDTPQSWKITLYSTKATAYTKNELITIVRALGATSTSYPINIIGGANVAVGAIQIPRGLYSSSASNLSITYYNVEIVDGALSATEAHENFTGSIHVKIQEL